MGGGNAMPRAVLAGLKKYPLKISVVCAMLDSGGSSGRLRKDYKIISPGDIRRAFISLANTSPAIENLFNYRFQTGVLKGHNFANLFITALELTSKNHDDVYRQLSKFLNVSHQVLPVTLSHSHLYAVLENGKLISGETNIDKPKHNGNLKIKKVFLKPKPEIYPRVREVIRRADLIVIGPGDLYSSLAQILLTNGVSEEIRKSGATLVYVCNLMTKYGETNHFSVLDFSNEIEKYLGIKIDYVIYNTKMPSKKRLLAFKKRHPELIDIVKIDKGLSLPKFIGDNLLFDRGVIEHDPKKLVPLILKLVQ